MSKAFTKDHAVDLPVVLPRRAPLPPGTPNYVTARGLARLEAERAAELESAHLQKGDSDIERAREKVVQQARLAELEARVASAVLVDAARQPRDEVRFGASVTVRSPVGGARRYRIVGVDEADAVSSTVAFVAPLARSLLGKRVGDVATVKTPSGEAELEILAIDYD